MSKEEKQRQTEKFVGCILSVKTKPGPYGDAQHIIGTVREIDVDSAEQAIVLDQAMSNGAMLPDGYVLLSSQIADLQVMGKASEIQARGGGGVVHNASDSIIGGESVASVRKSSSQPAGFAKTVNASFSNGSGHVNGNHFHNNNILPQPFISATSSTTLINSISSVVADYTVRNNLLDSDSDPNGHTIAKPKPRKPDSGIAYSNSSNHKGLSQVAGSGGGALIRQSPDPISINKSSTHVGLSSSSAGPDDGNILIRTFGNLSTNSTLNGQTLFNAVTNSTKISTISSSNLNASSPSKMNKQIMYDHKKLGVLSQFVSGDASSGQVAEDSQNVDLDSTPNKTINNTQADHKMGRGQGKMFGKQQRHGETFESMSNAEMAEEFDFEGSNAQFEKLPVNCAKPTKVVKNPPQFCTSDTTYLADRAVESVKLRESVTSVRKFVTDTGVVIPSVDLPTRSKILNLAHETGLTHSRVVEVMGRAVAQAVLPLLGDSYRLSPERTEDRPWVLVCAGPHWQGAIGIAAARTLASLGVHTCVHAPKEELQLCAVEERLYSLSGEMLTRQVGDLNGLQFDLVIMAVDDHLSRTLTLAPYARWLKRCAVVFVDPPLISSYRQPIDAVCGGTQKGRRIVIVSPVLPIAYPSDSTVKLFLVNLGIPQKIFEQNDVLYKSPFGDKLVIQIFSGSSK